MNGELLEFRDAINQAIAHGRYDLPVVGEDGIPMVVVALEDEPLFDLLGRLRAVGGNANLFVRGRGRVRRVSVADQVSPDAISDEMTGQEGPGPMASVGMFLDYLERRPHGVVLSVVNPATPAVARDVVEFAQTPGDSVWDPGERALRDEHLRNSLQDYTARTVPALDIDAYAERVYQANRASEG